MIKKTSNRLTRYDTKKYAAKKWKLGQNLNIGEKVLILAKRININSSWKKIQSPNSNPKKNSLKKIAKKGQIYQKKSPRKKNILIMWHPNKVMPK